MAISSTASKKKIHYISPCRNGVFACGTDQGVQIFNTAAELVAEITPSEFGSVRICEILRLTSLIAVVSWGTNPKFPNNEVSFWDDIKQDFVKRITVSGCILSLRFDGDRLYIVQREEIAFINVHDNSERQGKIYSSWNPKGVCTVGPHYFSQVKILAVPEENGGIHIYRINSGSQCPYTVGDPEKIKAHESDIAELSLNPDASMVASASVKGTLIRVFCTETKEKLHEFRRGMMNFVSIYNITFSDDSAFMASTSSSGTVHVYSLQSDSYSSIGSYISSYIYGNRSIGTFQVAPDFKTLCKFGTEQNIYAISYNGSLQLCRFNEKQGCSVKSLKFFLEPSEDEDDEFFDANQ